jgi:hypothetical protein
MYDIKAVELSGKERRGYLREKINELETNRTKISQTYI